MERNETFGSCGGGDVQTSVRKWFVRERCRLYADQRHIRLGEAFVLSKNMFVGQEKGLRTQRIFGRRSIFLSTIKWGRYQSE